MCHFAGLILPFAIVFCIGVLQTVFIRSSSGVYPHACYGFLVSTIRWMLPEVLENKGMSAYRLAMAMDRRRENTVYRLARPGSQPTSVNFDVLREILDALYELTSERVTLQDLISYVPE